MIKVYNKLVRDKIPQIIIASGKIPVTRQIRDINEMEELLILKLDEEIQEYKLSREPEELADILEVLRSLALHIHGMTPAELEEIRSAKERERGGFREEVVLEQVLDD